MPECPASPVLAETTMYTGTEAPEVGETDNQPVSLSGWIDHEILPLFPVTVRV